MYASENRSHVGSRLGFSHTRRVAYCASLLLCVMGAGASVKQVAEDDLSEWSLISPATSPNLTIACAHLSSQQRGALIEAISSAQSPDRVGWAANKRFEISKFRFKFPRAELILN